RGLRTVKEMAGPVTVLSWLFILALPCTGRSRNRPSGTARPAVIVKVPAPAPDATVPGLKVNVVAAGAAWPGRRAGITPVSSTAPAACLGAHVTLIGTLVG